MYRRNLERNRAIYELWEKGLTVDRIASLTGVPRSTVGYYVRKFNRLAAEGKPIVLPQESKVTRETSTPLKASEHAKKVVLEDIRDLIKEMFGEHKFQELYYLLMSLKLIRDTDSIVSVDTLIGFPR